MNRLNRLIFACLAVTHGASAAGLTWEFLARDIPCEPGQEEIRSSFPYRNEGELPVTIASIRSSCGCTVAEVPEKIVPPGGEGALEVVFTVGERMGPQRKTVRVTTEAGSGSSVETLTLKTDIPELGGLSPRMLLWRTSEGAVEKRVAIDAAPGTEWKVSDEQTKSVPFSWKVVSEEGTEPILLEVRPDSPMERGKWKIPVEFSQPDSEASVKKALFLIVR